GHRVSQESPKRVPDPVDRVVLRTSRSRVLPRPQRVQGCTRAEKSNSANALVAAPITNIATFRHFDKPLESRSGRGFLRECGNKSLSVDERRPDVRRRAGGFLRNCGAAAQRQSLVLDGAIEKLFCPKQILLLCRLRGAVAEHFADVLQSDAAEECADGARVSQRMAMGRALAPVLGFDLGDAGEVAKAPESRAP